MSAIFITSSDTAFPLESVIAQPLNWYPSASAKLRFTVFPISYSCEAFWLIDPEPLSDTANVMFV